MCSILKQKNNYIDLHQTTYSYPELVKFIYCYCRTTKMIILLKLMSPAGHILLPSIFTK